MSNEELDFSGIEDNPAAAEIIDRLPSPVAVRTVATALASVAAASLGRDLNITPVLDAVLAAYTVAVPFVLTIWFGHKAKKVAAVTPPTAATPSAGP